MRIQRNARKTTALVSALLLVLLLLPAGAVAGAGQKAAPPVDQVKTTPAMDADGNRIFDDLDGMLAGKGPNEELPVIVILEKGKGPGHLQSHVGKVDPRFEFPAINGFAANLKVGQIQRLSRVPFVVQVEYDRPVHALLDNATQWFGAQAARADYGVTGDRDGNETSYTKDDIVVAVIDTGIDPNHVDLDGGKIIGWKDFVNSRTAPYDDHGHGTHCASIATGEGQANPAYKGVAPGAALVGVKVLDAQGSGTLSNVDAGIQWAIDNKAALGIEIISLSLGTTGSSDGTDSTSQMVNAAFDAGLVPVVAAGNSGPGTSTIGSPGAALKALTVAAMADVGEKGFQLASFSSRGPTADGRTKPDISAPGVNIMAAKSGTTNQYVQYSGTSMATPFTAGTVALMLDANPALTPQQVKDTIFNTAVNWGPAGQDIDYGYGRLDTHAAVKSAGGFSGGTAPAVPGHDYRSGSLSATGDFDEYIFTVNSTAYPISITLMMSGGGTSPDVDLFLYDPAGTQIASSEGTKRQEQVGVAITAAGDYKVKVYSYSGSGTYTFDISAGLGSGGGDNPPTSSIAQPLGGATVSGTVRIKVSAADDKGISVVETAIDSGAYIDITGNFDGTHYYYDWDTTGVADGAHTIKARATDTAGQVTDAADVSVTVNNGSGSREHTLTFTGTVTSSSPDAWFDVNVDSTGYIYTTLNWGTTADLDFYVYSPSGTEIGRAYTLNNPETLRTFTDSYGTGKYRIRVNLYSGVNTSFTLTVDGYQKQDYTGYVDLVTPDSWQYIPMPYTGTSYFKLDWDGTYDDLDFYVYDPTGTYRSRAYTILKPETLWQTIDITGTWSVKVNLYAGIQDNYTLSVYVPVANLRY